MKDFYGALQARRSIYTLTNKSDISEDKIVELVEQAVKHAPSPFNLQSGRVVVLFGDSSKKFWNIVMEVLRGIVPADKFAPTEEKINGFGSGFGTVLFFEDMSAVRALQEKFPSYAENFELWSAQSNGMIEYIVWTSLAIEGLGASLQHYHPIIDDKVREAFSIPADWRFQAQMPFGKSSAPAGDKEFSPLSDRVKVFK